MIRATEVFRQLSISGKPMRFKAAPEPEPRDGSPAESEGPGEADRAPQASPGAPQGDVVPLPPELHLAAPGGDDPVGGFEAEPEEASGLDFVPYDSADLEDRHTDQYLQTASPPEALDRSLRRLEEQARLSLEEQGVNTLFLALGMLHYTESDGL